MKHLLNFLFCRVQAGKWQKQIHLRQTPSAVLRQLPVFFAIFLFGLMSCKKDDNKGTGNGDLVVEWSKAFGGTKMDFFTAFAPTGDGAYVVAGMANSNDGDVTGNHGAGDVWVNKIDRSGNILWQKAYGGTDDDWGWSVLTNPDNTYMVAGTTKSNDGNVTGNHGGQDIWLLKLGTNGNLLWQKTLGGTGDEAIEFSSIVRTTEGGYLLAGYTTSNDGDVTGNHGDYDAWLVKVSANGEVQWQKTIGGSGYDRVVSLFATKDGNYMMAGATTSNNGDVSGNHGGFDSWVVKVNGNGNILWQKCYGGSKDDASYLLYPTADGGFILPGQTNSPNDGDVKGWHGDYDAWVLKIDANGNLQWQKALGSSKYEDNYCLVITPDAGYLIGALTNGNDGDVSGNRGEYDAWFVKLDSKGELKWQKTLGGTGSENPTSMLATGDGSFLIGGQTTSSDGGVKNYHGEFDQWLYSVRLK